MPEIFHANYVIVLDTIMLARYLLTDYWADEIQEDPAPAAKTMIMINPKTENILSC